MCLAELSVPDTDDGGSSGLLAGVFRPAQPPAAAPPTLNLYVGPMVWDLAPADGSAADGGAISGAGPKAVMA